MIRHSCGVEDRTVGRVNAGELHDEGIRQTTTLRCTAAGAIVVAGVAAGADKQRAEAIAPTCVGSAGRNPWCVENQLTQLEGFAGRGVELVACRRIAAIREFSAADERCGRRFTGRVHAGQHGEQPG